MCSSRSYFHSSPKGLFNCEGYWLTKREWNAPTKFINIHHWLRVLYLKSGWSQLSCGFSEFPICLSVELISFDKYREGLSSLWCDKYLDERMRQSAGITSPTPTSIISPGTSYDAFIEIRYYPPIFLFRLSSTCNSQSLFIYLSWISGNPHSPILPSSKTTLALVEQRTKTIVQLSGPESSGTMPSLKRRGWRNIETGDKEP